MAISHFTTEYQFLYYKSLWIQTDEDLDIYRCLLILI